MSKRRKGPAPLYRDLWLAIKQGPVIIQVTPASIKRVVKGIKKYKDRDREYKQQLAKLNLAVELICTVHPCNTRISFHLNFYRRAPWPQVK